MRRWFPPFAVAWYALLACLAVALAGCSTATAGAARTPQKTTAVASQTPVPLRGAPGLRAVPAGRLPAAARRTLRLIADGGPFPYARDGVVFGNYEGLLPHRRRGYYHEYTAPTPGVRGRGARRIVTGAADQRYYTADHYRSFVVVSGG